MEMTPKLRSEKFRVLETSVSQSTSTWCTRPLSAYSISSNQVRPSQFSEPQSLQKNSSYHLVNESIITPTQVKRKISTHSKIRNPQAFLAALRT